MKILSSFTLSPWLDASHFLFWSSWLSPHPITVSIRHSNSGLLYTIPYVPGPKYQATKTAFVPLLLEVIPTRSSMGSLGILASHTPLVTYRVLPTVQVAYHVSVQPVGCPTWCPYRILSPKEQSSAFYLAKCHQTHLNLTKRLNTQKSIRNAVNTESYSA